MPGEIAETFLSDGGQSADSVAAQIASFIGDARGGIDLAIYDFDTDDEASSRIAEVLVDAIRRGVKVRAAHNVDGEHGPGAPPPPRAATKVTALDFPMRAVTEEGALMHDKYIVRDSRDVLTGSTNWTDDAFHREENVVITVEDAPDLAAAYTRNFEHMFTYGHIHGSGGGAAQVLLEHGVTVQPFFSPMPLGQIASAAIARADRRLRVVSPVITSGAVLGTLAEFASRERFDLRGAYDATQMEDVVRSWEEVEHNHWKISAWRVVQPRLSGKRSTPWSPYSVHDFMHAKFVVSDSEVIAGSYNLSRHGERNAENVLRIVGQQESQRFADFADKVADRYAG
jgi:phosphatidylserine/phosphatidylglycerophosphate/cardiolipin synthase-like enzyme